jgi:hypothetical protein
MRAVLRDRLPERRTLAAVALVAFLHAAAWAVLTPTLQVPDEPVHVGYVAKVYEERDLAPPLLPSWAPSEELGTVFSRIPFSILVQPSWFQADESELERILHAGELETTSRGNAGYVGNNPPLYPAVMSVPYGANELAGGDILDGILLMRLVTALLAGLTVAGVWLFLRELFPRSPFLWTVGALAVALHPMVGFIGGGVNNDNLVNLAGAWFLFTATRFLSRGPTLRRAAAMGVPVAVALLTKVSAFALFASLLLALAISLLRVRRVRALGPAAVAFAVSVVPYAVYSALSARSSETATSGLVATRGFDWYTPDAIAFQLSYLWQWWLPRLPWMNSTFDPGFYPADDVFLQGFIGRFGWHQWGFSESFYVWGRLALAAVAVLALAGIWRSRHGLRQRWPVALALPGFALLATLMINIAGFRFREITGGNFEQVRYFFPVLLGLYGALVAFAVRGAGRWGPAVGTAVLVLATGHVAASMLGVFGRYYL